MVKLVAGGTAELEGNMDCSTVCTYKYELQYSVHIQIPQSWASHYCVVCRHHTEMDTKQTAQCWHHNKSLLAQET
jgi:hypothetical protein